jgi:hypothetical protein
MPPPTNEELFEMMMDLQADISALTRLMFEADPNLASEYRARADQLRKDLRRAYRERQESER